MVLPSLASLTELCCIHLAYLQWIRTNVANSGIIYVLSPLEDVVLDAVRNLDLPEELEPLVVKHVRHTGGTLFCLLNLWQSKLPDDTLQNERICEMLFDCLVLNADAQINQRRTAQTLLRNKVLDNVLAFRLACINFLETEVLKLWILVKEYFLNKLVQECNHLDVYASDYIRSDEYLNFILEDIIRTSETEEVVFWIGQCLSRENGVDIREVPHIMGRVYDWNEFALDSAVASGNVTCFDYFKNFSSAVIEHDYLDRIKRILRSAGGKYQLASFIFHFMLLNFDEKSELFQEFPREMVNQFLQWPLSQTFLQNAEEVWNLVPDVDKHWVFSEVYDVLIFENVVSHRPHILRFFPSSPTYCEEHFLGIGFALWNISPDIYKSAFLDLRIFPDFPDLHDDEFFIRFEESGMKSKLLRLFLSNVEALLELYQGETLQQSLSNVVKYMLADLDDLDRRYISLFEARMPFFLLRRNRGRFEMAWPRGCRVAGRYLDYIKNFIIG